MKPKRPARRAREWVMEDTPCSVKWAYPNTPEFDSAVLSHKDRVKGWIVVREVRRTNHRGRR